MGKDDKKEESGFGFKDKAKAEETLELLKTHDTAYQRLTVRGLLGRAKRVLTLTKAEDKLKNIKEAMEVFEKWLKEYESEHPPKSKSSKKPELKKKQSTSEEEAEEDSKNDGKKEKETKVTEETPTSDTVPGLGFKDKEKAVETIKLLEGRDPDYQKLAVKGLIGRAKRVLTCTRDNDKIQNIKDAMDVFENFLDDFDKSNLSKQNMSYLPLTVVQACHTLALQRGISCSSYEPFINAYKKVGGEYKKLRTVTDEKSKTTWDIIRNKELKIIKKKTEEVKFYVENGNPSNDHLKLILWGYSPEDHKLKKLKIKEECDVDMKDKSVNKDKRETDKDRKRRYESSSSPDSNSEEETPGKKKK